MFRQLNIKKITLIYFLISCGALLLCFLFQSKPYKDLLEKTEIKKIDKKLNETQQSFDKIIAELETKHKERDLEFTDFTKYNKKKFIITLIENGEIKYWSNRLYSHADVLKKIQPNVGEIYPFADKLNYAYRYRLSPSTSILFLTPITNTKNEVTLTKFKLGKYMVSMRPMSDESSLIVLPKSEKKIYLNALSASGDSITIALKVSWCLFLLVIFLTIYSFFSNKDLNLPNNIVHIGYILALIIVKNLINLDPFDVQRTFNIFTDLIYVSEIFKGESLGSIGVGIFLILAYLSYWYSKPIIQSNYVHYFDGKLVSVITGILFACSGCFMFLLLRSLILDSSLHVYYFIALDLDTIVLVITMIFTGFVFYYHGTRLIRFVNQLDVRNPQIARLSFVVSVVISSIFLFIYFKFTDIWIYIFWILLFIGTTFIFISNNNKVNHFWQIITTILIFSIIATVIIRKSLNSKNEIILKEIANKIRLQDDEAILELREIIPSLQHDKTISSSLLAHNISTVKAEELIKKKYFTKSLSGYSVDVNIYTQTNLNYSKDLFDNFRPYHDNVLDPNIEMDNDNFEYYSKEVTIPVYSEMDELILIYTIEFKKDKLLDFKKSATRGYRNNNSFFSFEDLYYSILEDKKLIFQKGNTIEFSEDELDRLKIDQFSSLKSGKRNYVYKYDENSFVLISASANQIKNFSYETFAHIFTLLIYIYLLSVVAVYQFKIDKMEFYRNSISNRIQFVVLGIIYGAAFFIAFFTIFSVNGELRRNKTYAFYNLLDRVNTSYRKSMTFENFTIENSTSREYKKERFKLFRRMAQNAQQDFRYKDQGMLVYFFNNEGVIEPPFDKDLFDKKVWSNRVNPVVLNQFLTTTATHHHIDEKLFDKQYVGYYLALRDKDMNFLGGVYFPTYNIDDTVKTQQKIFTNRLYGTFSMVLVLITIATLITTNSFTKILYRIREILSQVDIGQSYQKIEWQNDDEIGMLVTEYNDMVSKLDENAVVLARVERENAWRDLAKQIAHEIKNPLTPMKLSIQHLKRRLTDEGHSNDSPIFKTLNTIVQQIQHLSNIADNFSSVSKMETPEYEFLDLSKQLEEVMSLFESNERYNFTYINKIYKKEAIVRADKTMLNRVFTNLIKNAIQALMEDRRGNIQVRLEEMLNEYQVSVIDNGKGIANKDRAKIFTPNFTTKKSGTGIGLMMTKKIIDMHGGKIKFESKPNIGTTFIVTFPKS